MHSIRTLPLLSEISVAEEDKGYRVVLGAHQLPAVVCFTVVDYCAWSTGPVPTTFESCVLTAYVQLERDPRVMYGLELRAESTRILEAIKADDVRPEVEAPLVAAMKTFGVPGRTDDVQLTDFVHWSESDPVVARILAAVDQVADGFVEHRLRTYR